MLKQHQAPLLTDLPSPEDYLDFEPYRQTLRDIINDKHTDTPLTVGVFGTWGTGKTTLLKMVRSDLEADHVTVWFNAWKYDKEDALWRALLLRVIAAVRQVIPDDDEQAQCQLRDLEETLYQAIEREELGNFEIDWREFVKGATGIGAKIVMATVPGLNLAASVIEEAGKKVIGEGPDHLLAAFKRARTQVRLAQIQSIEQFEGQLAGLVERYIMPSRLVVFVDDLDRCLPQKAIEVLEAIKLFLDVPGCVFVLGVDRNVIAQGIRVKYRELAGEIDGSQYLEKIIQLPFDLPLLDTEDVRSYVHSLAPSLPDARCEEVFASGWVKEANPRQIKRTMNMFLFLSRLAVARAERKRLVRLEDVRLAKVVVIQHNYPDLYNLLRTEPRLLAELESHYRARQTHGEREERIAEQENPLPALPERLQAFATHDALGRLLALFNGDESACFATLPPADIRLYFTLVQSVAVTQPAPQARVSYEPQTISVPEGEFLMGTSNEEIAWLVENTDWAQEWVDKGRFKDEQQQHSLWLPAYAIGRYPVTNLEYQAFVEAAGYQSPQHWNGPKSPEAISDHPVVCVSQEDALAYCVWLTQSTGKPYRLPSEAEWEKAARGKDGRLYPWGSTFDPTLCNTGEGGPGTTTPVGQYSPGGDSPFGCADMAGSIWEWMLSLWGTDVNKPDFGYPYQADDGREDISAGPGLLRVVRGGSWLNFQSLARCAYRVRGSPNYRSNNNGFRVIVAKVGNVS